MSEDNKITFTDADRALYAFDAKNNVEPARAIAERICDRYSIPTEGMVNDIAHAIEDAMELGQRRGKFLP